LIIIIRNQEDIPVGANFFDQGFTGKLLIEKLVHVFLCVHGSKGVVKRFPAHVSNERRVFFCGKPDRDHVIQLNLLTEKPRLGL
jgi:hypothetical protein